MHHQSIQEREKSLSRHPAREAIVGEELRRRGEGKGKHCTKSLVE